MHWCGPLGHSHISNGETGLVFGIWHLGDVLGNGDIETM
jgi:hypothetical protein